MATADPVNELEAKAVAAPDPTAQKKTENPDTEPLPSTVLSGGRLYLVMFSLLVVGLDQTINYRIASEFNSFSLQGWISTAFIMAQTVLLLFYGQLMRVFPAKLVLLAAIGLFEVGSLVCGVAHSAEQLIAGRVISGLGGAGVFVSMLQVMSEITTLKDRPRFFGMFGATFGISTIAGPLIGGAFTDHASWRWCFFINLPIGGLSIVAVTLFLKASPPLGSDPNKRTMRDILKQTRQLDFLGAILVGGAVTSLILALQWGGNLKPWNDKAVIICFVFAAVLTVAFILWENYMGERAMTPLEIFHSRSVYAIVIFSVFIRSLVLLSYYVPLFYQITRNYSATKAGINIFPLVLSMIFTSIGTGQIVSRIGYYWPFLVASPCFLALGSGLMFTISTTTPAGRIAGFLIIIGVGIGLGMQNSLIAMQAEFKDNPKLLAQSTSMASFAGFLGGTVGLGVAEPILASLLTKYLRRYAPDAPADIAKQSPTAIYTQLPASVIPGVLKAYTQSLRIVFILGLPVAACALLAAIFIRNIRIVKEEKKGDLEGNSNAEKGESKDAPGETGKPQGVDSV
ncbi:major facilitator transporter-like protein [Favolaschia claudopus]|uniref:Major facilitator transporter-like protein n=1 Tax=Favolaschia claudopus TaxID=2862362 RepID=A0AAW0DRW2_9AGAR